MRFPLFTHRFRLSGLNLERFLNLMKREEIPLLSIRRKSAKELVCECFSADLSAIANFVQEKGWRMEDIQPLGLSAFWRRACSRPGIPIGLALMVAAMLILSQFVWRIDVHNAGAYQADIALFLKDSGYHTGIPRRSVDAKALESALLHRYPEIAWFHVYITNMTLVVEVSHGVPMPTLPSDEPGHIVADRNGIIHSIRVFAGTPVVKAGDVVQKGDILIRGVERARDEQQTYVRADGVVQARCWDSFTAAVPLYDVISTETGREAAFSRIHTPWFDYPFQPQTPDFLTSDLHITQTPIVGAFFPVFYQRLTYREVSLAYQPRDVQEVEKEAANAAIQQLKTALFDDEIIDKWVDYCMIEGDRLAATVTAERLVDIGAFSAP